MRLFGTMALVLALGAAAVAPAAAAGSWGGTLGGGVALPQDVAKDRLNRGWDLQSGSTFKVGNSVAILMEVMYNKYGVSDTTLQNLQVPEGKMRILSGTVNFMVGPGATGSGPYLIGGGGIYNRKIELSKPTTGGVIVVDPWLGVVAPIVIPPGDVIGTFSTTKPGINGGVGLSLGKNSRAYLEARYHWVFTDNVKTTFIPINFGLRW